jgi:hypothetical protein
MRWNRLATLLLSSAALLAAGAASAQAPPESNLLTGALKTVDKKNPLVSANTRVMPLGENTDPSPNQAVVRGACVAGGDSVQFRFEAGLVDKSNITDKKAQLDQKHKENPAAVFGVLPGTCDGAIPSTVGDSCFVDDDCDPATPAGDGVCLPTSPPIPRECTAGTIGVPCNTNADCDIVFGNTVVEEGTCGTVRRCIAPALNEGKECASDSQCDSQGNCGASCTAPLATVGDECADDSECDSPNDGVCDTVTTNECTAPFETAGNACAADSDCDSPPGLCEGSNAPEVPLLCGKATVSSKVQTGKDGKFKGNASQCTAASASLVAAAEIACPDAKNIKVTTKSTVVEKVKISGNGPTVEVSP